MASLYTCLCCKFPSVSKPTALPKVFSCSDRNSKACCDLPHLTYTTGPTHPVTCLSLQLVRGFLENLSWQLMLRITLEWSQCSLWRKAQLPLTWLAMGNRYWLLCRLLIHLYNSLHLLCVGDLQCCLQLLLSCRSLTSHHAHFTSVRSFSCMQGLNCVGRSTLHCDSLALDYQMFLASDTFSYMDVNGHAAVHYTLASQCHVLLYRLLACMAEAQPKEGREAG